MSNQRENEARLAIARKRCPEQLRDRVTSPPPTGLALTLPFPPSVNAYFVPIPCGRKARLILGEAGRQYAEDVAVATRGQPSFGKARLDVSLFFHPDPKISWGQYDGEYDSDNRVKPLFDAMQKAGLFNNDKQIIHHHVTKSNQAKGGYVNVFISLARPDVEIKE